MGGGSSEEQYTQPDQKPWIGTDAVFRYYGDRPTQYQRNQMSDVDMANFVAEQRKPNVIIPDTGAAKYWYVDPRAKNFDASQYADEQGHTGNDPQSDALNQLADALDRIGVVPQGQTGF